MSLNAGDRLGPYEVRVPIGEGGMGEVFRARDSRLDRDVAVKILPATLSQDGDYVARFRREAQVLASLNHPNIAQIYGLEADAIVMELVEGPTLAERLAQGPLPLEETVAIAKQIAEALEVAHEKGITHRDLKPANVKITPDGTVKVLDFGLARVTERASVSGSPISSPTMTIGSTQAGLILGTAAYMSPEQAAGKPVDRRADIWSFGVVLWEMLTGTQLFAGETISHTLADVLRAPIDLKQLPAGTPPAIRQLVTRCLDRDIKSRLQWIGEARVALQKYATDPTLSVIEPVGDRRSSWPLWALGAVATVALAIAGVLWFKSPRLQPLRPLVRLEVEVAAHAQLTRSGGGAMFALSPDGTRLVLTLRGADGTVRLYTRLLHEPQLTPLRGSENAASPFFSPDSKWIGFSADGKLKKVAVEGGVAVTLADAPREAGANWGDDGNIVLTLSPSSGLSQVSSLGGTPASITSLQPGERTHRHPHVLPGSKAVLFISSSDAGGYSDANIEVASLRTGARKVLLRGGFSPRYVATASGVGYLIYLSETTLFAVPFDADRLVLAGTPAPVLEEVGGLSRSGGDFSFTQAGTFVYLTRKEGDGSKISWLDSSGKVEPLHDIPGMHNSPTFSPDGERLVFSTRTSQGTDLWVKDLERGIHSRLTSLPGLNRSPVWTGDGSHILFQCSNPTGLCLVRSDGSGSVQRLSESSEGLIPYSISPDGSRLAWFGVPSPPVPGIGRSLYTAVLSGGPGQLKLGKKEPFLESRFDAAQPTFSPDGRWLAYSQETGESQVYVQPFPGPGPRVQISTENGRYPIWSRSNRELFFEGDHLIMVAAYTIDGNTFKAAKPHVWSKMPMRGTGYGTYDIAPDGKRAAAILAENPEAGPEKLTHLTFLLNFADELQRRFARSPDTAR